VLGKTPPNFKSFPKRAAASCWCTASYEILQGNSRTAVLLDNSLKYTPAPGRIDVALISVSGRPTPTVRDTGIGIAESDLPHIFDRFYRADPSRSQVEGSGLGLAIAKWIADLHHAEVLVDSEQRKGSAFRVVFPRSDS
jgi:signal transduction histidine kinase